MPVVTFSPVEGLQVYVEAPFATNETESPEQNVVAPEGVMATVGDVLIVTITESVALQLPLTPVMVYVVVDTGLAVTEAPVVALKPVAGNHEYVVPPLAVNSAPTPEHTDGDVGVTEIVGVGVTVIT